jgi:hypothetical protein
VPNSLRKLSNDTLAIYYLLFDANGRMQSCQAGSRQEVTLDCLLFCFAHRLYHLQTNGHLQSTRILLALMCNMSSLEYARMQLGRDQKAPVSSWHLSTGGSASAQIRGQFLIANLELEFNLNIHESITYNFLIANKMRFFNPQLAAVLPLFSSLQPRASSL